MQSPSMTTGGIFGPGPHSPLPSSGHHSPAGPDPGDLRPPGWPPGASQNSPGLSPVLLHLVVSPKLSASPSGWRWWTVCQEKRKGRIDRCSYPQSGRPEFPHGEPLSPLSPSQPTLCEDKGLSSSPLCFGCCWGSSSSPRRSWRSVSSPPPTSANPSFRLLAPSGEQVCLSVACSSFFGFLVLWLFSSLVEWKAC